MNLTKLRQRDLRWDVDKCSGDLKLSGSGVTKVSEIFGDYSTVLADQGETTPPCSPTKVGLLHRSSRLG